jgi:hypothetical protein
MSKKIIIIGIVAIIILALGAGVWVWEKEEMKKEEMVTNQAAKNSNIDQKISTKSQDEIASVSDWKSFPDENRKGQIIYKSDRFNFQFSVPDSWEDDVKVEDKESKYYNKKTASNKIGRYEKILFDFKSKNFDDRTILDLGKSFVIDFRKGINFTADVTSTNTLDSDFENYEYLKSWYDELFENEAYYYNAKLTNKDILFKDKKAFLCNIYGSKDKRIIKEVVFVDNGGLFKLRAMFKEDDEEAAKTIEEVFNSFEFLGEDA